MTLRIGFGLGLLISLLLATSSFADSDPAREALEKLNDFVGDWKGAGSTSNKKENWSETLTWGWRFQGGPPSLIGEFRGAKDWNRAQLTYDPPSKKYRLVTTDSGGKQRFFEGEYKRGFLTLDSTEAASGETLRIRMNSAGEGLRFVYSLQRRPKGSTIFTPVYQVEAGKVGESLAGGTPERECVVTGGRGTIPVTYQGKTYYVCCSGCRDAFNENPEKILKEYAERKKKEK
jgi:hypothetical protein